MAINKNFVVKNGLEVNSNLIIADATRNKVGIASTAPRTELDVRGGIAATDINISGVGTIVTLQSTTGTITNLTSGGTVQATHVTASGVTTATTLNVTGTGTIAVGVVTNLSGTNLNYAGIATVNSLSIGSTQIVSNTRQLQNIASLDATTTATIEAAISNAPNTLSDLRVTGISTLGQTTANGLVVTGFSTLGATSASSVSVSGIVTATRFIGAGQIGIRTEGSVLGYGVSFLDIRGAGVSTTLFNASAGIATIFFQGGGSGSASIGIGTTPGQAFTGIVTTGNLWYNSDLGRLFIYYNDGDSAQWVDAAPFNIGVLNPVSIALSTGTATLPSLYFSGNTNTGLFQNTTNQWTAVAAGASVLNINPGGVNITGVTTSTGGFIGALTGNVTGTATTATLATNAQGLTGTPNITVGNVTATNVNVSGITTSVRFNVGTAQTINATGINVTGVVTATSFVGDGSGLTGAGATLNDDTTTNATYYPVFSTATSGSLTTAKVSSTKLTYNPSTGQMTAVDFNSTSDVNLKTNIQTVENALNIVNSLRGVSFDWKESGLPSYGVIAQELEQILPELVKGEEQKSVNYNGIIGVLIEAIKELKSEIEKLKKTK